MGQGLLNDDPLVRVEGQHFLQQVQRLRVRVDKQPVPGYLDKKQVSGYIDKQPVR